ncbi:hypothetical protein E6C27_scaffold578G001030 [Cucumis melo var. makuwa]|uniref:Uncharacterized protein n=1 Tax=Cucumis melo var. makuwa TaxID=1194695 RepID=A0A5A7U8N0_CUCMM|nr:hypothetical protein E6C27_scaffold578G001030 [Cucumis melo var. makuwa]
MGEEEPKKTLRELYDLDVHQRPIGTPTTTNFHLRLPYNQLIERDIVQYFYSGLLSSVRDSIDVTLGEALIDKTPSKGEVPKVVSCGVCGILGHHNDQCSEIKKWGPQEPKPNNTSSSSSSSKGTYLEDIVSSSFGVMENDMETMKASISELGNKLDQLAIHVLKMEEKGKLPAQSNHASNIVDNPLPHFPPRLYQSRKEFKNDEELLEVFKKVEVNLPLLTAIKSIPRSFILPLEVVEDVLVKVGHQIFPVNFYIIEMNNKFARTSPTILLGRLFLKTAKAIINIDKGLLSVKFDGDVVSFNIFDDVKSSSNHVSLCALDTLDSLETLEEHDKLNELIDQATLEYVVVKKEVLKLKDTSIIYSILHSTWVSPIHVVPKKTGLTIVENSQGSAELTLKFSGSAADLVGISFFPWGKGFPTTGPRVQVKTVVIHRGLHVSDCAEYLYGLVCIKHCSGCGSWSLDGGGHTGLICASFGSTRLICVSFGSTGLISVSFGSTRLISVSFGSTRLICRDTARGRPTRGRKGA